MAVSDNIAAPAWVLFIAIYISVFILSTVGNTCVLLTCYKTLKRRHSPLGIGEFSDGGSPVYLSFRI